MCKKLKSKHTPIMHLQILNQPIVYNILKNLAISLFIVFRQGYSNPLICYVIFNINYSLKILSFAYI